MDVEFDNFEISKQDLGTESQMKEMNRRLNNKIRKLGYGKFNDEDEGCLSAPYLNYKLDILHYLQGIRVDD